jgi:hypothetical protein
LSSAPSASELQGLIQRAAEVAALAAAKFYVEHGQPIQPEFLSPATAAKFLDVPVRTLESLRNRGLGPPFVRIGEGRGRIRYSRIALIEFMRGHEVREE